MRVLHLAQRPEQLPDLLMIEIGEFVFLQLQWLQRGQRVRVVNLLKLHQAVEHRPKVGKFVVHRLAAIARLEALGAVLRESNRRKGAALRIAQALDHPVHQQLAAFVVAQHIPMQHTPPFQQLQ